MKASSSLSGLAGSSKENPKSASKKKKTSRREADDNGQKRRCISTACIACRKRKSKCDGALPSCAACASVYGTDCIYDPNSDHRRKGVYRDKIDSTKAKESTLQILIDAIVNSPEQDVAGVVRKIRNCDNLDMLAQETVKSGNDTGDSSQENTDEELAVLPQNGEGELAGKMGELRLENGSVRYIGGTSHLIYFGDTRAEPEADDMMPQPSSGRISPITTWTEVTNDIGLITHLMNMYFAYHYAYFTTLSKNLFWKDFMRGRGHGASHCSSLLVNAMLALGCHFTDVAGAHAIPGDSRTKGDHFFAEAKRLIVENDLFERPHIVTVQALSLMSVREAGCAREAKGWVYSGMSFRMALDIGLNLEISTKDKERLTDEEIDARRITFWGCFLFDKCWSNYMGRLPQLPRSSSNVPKFDVFPDEDSSTWMPLTDKGFDESAKQPARTRAAALQLANLCEISSDILLFFYHPGHIGSRSGGKGAELKKLGDLHQRLEEWHKALPKEFEAKDGQLPNVILMHMFFHLQYIHLFRPFLKYAPTSSPLPSHVSPRRICTANAGAISKLMRLYKKNWNMRQICNIAVYMVHSACIIHLLNLPEKTAKRDIAHGVKHLEEIAEDWLCARRTLSILSVLTRKWNCELPDDVAQALQRADEKYGYYTTSDVPSPHSTSSGRSGTASEEINMSSMKQDYNNANAQYMLSQMSQTSHQSHQSHQSSLDSRMAGGPHHAQPKHSNISVESSPMAFSPIDLWNHHSPMTPVTQGTPNYTGGMSVGMVGAHPPPHQQHQQHQPQPPQHTLQDLTAKAAALDNSQWIFTDSARWQRNFEGWDVNAMPTSAPFVFGDHSAGPQPSHVAAGIVDQHHPHHHQHPPHPHHQQQQQQLPHPHPHPHAQQPPRMGYETYDPSLSCGGWLPSLE